MSPPWRRAVAGSPNPEGGLGEWGPPPSPSSPLPLQSPGLRGRKPQGWIQQARRLYDRGRPQPLSEPISSTVEWKGQRLEVTPPVHTQHQHKQPAGPGKLPWWAWTFPGATGARGGLRAKPWQGRTPTARHCCHPGSGTSSPWLTWLPCVQPQLLLLREASESVDKSDPATPLTRTPQAPSPSWSGCGVVLGPLRPTFLSATPATLTPAQAPICHKLPTSKAVLTKPGFLLPLPPSSSGQFHISQASLTPGSPP